MGGLISTARPWDKVAYGAIAIAVAALAWHGPVAQLEHYHDFADRRAWLGLPNALDVLSNLPFALVAAWAWLRIHSPEVRVALGAAWPGCAAFVISLALTALGSSYYHWAPDNAHLVWDRIPIALACAGLLAGAYARTHPARPFPALLPALLAVAIGSVAWWWVSETRGHGDLRPYLLLQFAPLVVVPLWQAQARVPSRERWAFAGAIVLYAVAKIAELEDARILAVTGFVSGHTLKHLLAAAASVFIVPAFGLPPYRRSSTPAA
jgi:hypothetical protein